MMTVLCQNIKHIQINESQNNFGIYFQKTTKMGCPHGCLCTDPCHLSLFPDFLGKNAYPFKMIQPIFSSSKMLAKVSFSRILMIRDKQ